jgi:hypothetical protein
MLGLTRILVLSDQLQAEYIPAGIRPRRVMASADWSGANAPALQQALLALLAQLPATRWQKIELYLADQHVHLLRLPAMTQGLQPFDWTGQDQQAYARAMLMQTYGEAARNWPFRLQDVCQPQDSLLVAIPVLQSLDWQALLSPHAMQWQVQAYACALWANTRLPKTGTVLTAEPQMMRLLQLEHGRMMHVAGLAASLDAIEDIADWVLRERTLLGVQASACYWLTEPGSPEVLKAGHRLKQALAGQLSWQLLQSASPLTHMRQEVRHVAAA